MVAIKKHTILHTIETGGPGGAETVLLNLASKVDRNRFRPLALISEDGWLRNRLEEEGIPTFLVHWQGGYDLRLLRAMMKLIREQDVELIHSHMPGHNFYNCVAGKLTGCKAIVTYHGPVELADVETLKAKFKFWVIRNWATVAVVVCDYVGSMLREVGFPSNKIVRIYNGIDIDRFCESTGGRLRQELGLQNGSKLVGMVANLRASKGYEFFVQAARKIADVMPEVRFVSVGDLDPVIGREIQELVRKLSLENRFFFLGFRNDVPDVLRDLDLFVLSSTREGLPLVALEAMAARKPIVATDCGGVQEVVEDGRTGYLAAPGNPDALAEKSLELLRDSRKALMFAENGRSRVSIEFALATMIQHYECLYERVLTPV